MTNLQEVCDKLLDNADLVLSIDGLEGVIKLEFRPASLEEVITFSCKRFTRLNFRKYADDTSSVTVLRTNVTIKEDRKSIAALRVEDGWLSFNSDLLNPVVQVEVEGDMMLSIVCERFSWQIGDGQVQEVL